MWRHLPAGHTHTEAVLPVASSGPAWTLLPPGAAGKPGLPPWIAGTCPATCALPSWLAVLVIFHYHELFEAIE